MAIPTDTIFDFAAIFNLSVAEILAVNPGFVDPNVIFPGQIITIPAPPPVSPEPGFARAQYLVRPGDTLFLIARRFGLTVPLLVAENPQILDPDHCYTASATGPTSGDDTNLCFSNGNLNYDCHAHRCKCRGNYCSEPANC